MKRRRLPLWGVGLGSWVVVSLLTRVVLPSEPGPHSERPFGTAVLIGALVGLPMMVGDLARGPGRIWLWGLVSWGSIWSLGVFRGIRSGDSDLDQIFRGAFLLGAMTALPLFLAFLVALMVRDRPGRTKKMPSGRRRLPAVRPRRWRMEIHARHIELVRRRHQSDALRSDARNPSDRG